MNMKKALALTIMLCLFALPALLVKAKRRTFLALYPLFIPQTGIKLPENFKRTD